MEVDEVEDYARRRYNVVGDTRFFTSLEIQRYIWAAEMELARETFCIRNTFSTVSVAGQQEYPFPSRTLAIKRVSYDGVRVEPRSLAEVLALTSSVAAPIGQPAIYAIWNEVLYLAPIPGVDDLTILIFSIDEPEEVETSATLSVPSRYHLDLSEYVVWQMAVKDKNYNGASYHEKRWRDIVNRAKAFERKSLRTDQQGFMRDADRDFDSWTSIR